MHEIGNNIIQIINKLTRLLDYVRTKYKTHTTCYNVTPKRLIKSQVTLFIIKFGDMVLHHMEHCLLTLIQLDSKV